MTVVRDRLLPAFALVGLLLLPISVVGASEPVEIRILGTNDLHAYLRPLHYRYLDEIKPWGRQSREGDYVAKAALQGKLGGMANVAAVIERLRAERPDRTLILDAGDTWHGAGLSVFDKGVTMVKIMKRHRLRRHGARQLGIHLRQGSPPRSHRYGGISRRRLQRDRPRVGRPCVSPICDQGGGRSQGGGHRYRLSVDRAHLVSTRLGRRLEIRAQGGGSPRSDRRHPRRGGPGPRRGGVARRLRDGSEVCTARRRYRRAVERPHPRRDLRPGGLERHHRLSGRSTRKIREQARRTGQGQAGRSGIPTTWRWSGRPRWTPEPRGPASGGRRLPAARSASERGGGRESRADLPARLLAEPHGRAADRCASRHHRRGDFFLPRVALRRHADAGNDHRGGCLQSCPDRRPHQHLFDERQVDQAADGEHPRWCCRHRPLRPGRGRHDPVLRHGAHIRSVQPGRRAGRRAAGRRTTHRAGEALLRRLGAHPISEQPAVRRRAYRRGRSGVSWNRSSSTSAPTRP